jgi:hypothetical protein
MHSSNSMQQAAPDRDNTLTGSPSIRAPGTAKNF